MVLTAFPLAASAQQGGPDDVTKKVNGLDEKLGDVTRRLDQADAERLSMEAEIEARSPDEEAKPEDRVFLEGGLGLQKLNPEISFFADILPSLVVERSKFYAAEDDRSSLAVRAVGLHFQHVLDPYSMFKSAFEISPHEGLHVEEVYVTWFGLARSTSLTMGRFRQNFGVLNRWHGHDLDQSDFPLALKLVLGDEGLVGNGLAARWLMPPLWAHANELTLEVVDGDNELLFAGEHYSVPAAMLHLKNYYDLSGSTYLELGLTGMFGFNNKRGFTGEDNDGGALSDEPWRRTLLGGADLTLYWSPLQEAKYSSFTWRSELYYASKELPEGSAEHFRRSWGVYSYIQHQLSARWFWGVRWDTALPTERESDRAAWDVVPYLTFWQSEFVYFRLELSRGERIPYPAPEGGLPHRVDNRVVLQIDFAAGPHKHEKY